MENARAFSFDNILKKFSKFSKNLRAEECLINTKRPLYFSLSTWFLKSFELLYITLNFVYMSVDNNNRLSKKRSSFSENSDFSKNSEFSENSDFSEFSQNQIRTGGNRNRRQDGASAASNRSPRDSSPPTTWSPELLDCSRQLPPIGGILFSMANSFPLFVIDNCPLPEFNLLGPHFIIGRANFSVIAHPALVNELPKSFLVDLDNQYRALQNLAGKASKAFVNVCKYRQLQQSCSLPGSLSLPKDIKLFNSSDTHRLALQDKITELNAVYTANLMQHIANTSVSIFQSCFTEFGFRFSLNGRWLRDAK